MSTFVISVSVVLNLPHAEGYVPYFLLRLLNKRSDLSETWRKVTWLNLLSYFLIRFSSLHKSNKTYQIMYISPKKYVFGTFPNPKNVSNIILKV